MPQMCTQIRRWMKARVQVSAHIRVSTQSQVGAQPRVHTSGICAARGGAQGEGGSCRWLCQPIVMAEGLATAGEGGSEDSPNSSL